VIPVNRFDKCYNNYVMWDQLAVACALDPGVIVSSTKTDATVELGGRFTRGQMVVESRHRFRGGRDNVVVIDEIDKEKFEKLVLDAFADDA
jgi:inosine-uridine nucleoside N-ribohydrolase